MDSFLNDESIRALQGIIVSLTTLTFLKIMYSAGQKKRAGSSPCKISYSLMSKVFTWIIWVGLGGSVFFMWFLIESNAMDAQLLKAGSAMILIFGALNIAMQLEFYRVKVTWDQEKIYTFSPWRKKRIIPIHKVRRIEFSKTMQWYKIYTEGYGIIRLHLFTQGIPDLLNSLPISKPPYPPH